MNRMTLGQLKSGLIASTLGICPDDAQFVAYVNEATKRLINKGNWVGTYGKFTICTDSSCITWPRQLMTIESIAVCGQPIPVRNQWFEFMSTGAGLAGGGCCFGDGVQLAGNSCGCAGQMFDRGTACAFKDIRGDNKKIKVYADVTEADNARILLQGYDENNNWIRTQDMGAWVDGEYVSISASTPATSTHLFKSLVAVIKPQTNGNIRLYEFNTDDSTQRAIAIYEPTELTPIYRRSHIPGIVKGGCSNGLVEDACQQSTVSVMAKLNFIPVANDNDFLMIGNEPALKEACRSVRYGMMDSATAMQQQQVAMAAALVELQTELEAFLGSGAKQSIAVEVYPVGALSMQSLI